MGLVRNNIAAMQGYAPGEQPQDPNVIKLNTNENPYPPSPRALAVIRTIASDALRRYPNPEARCFLEAAARVHGVSADKIITTNGGDELLALVFRACVGENDAVAFLEPSYSLYPVLAAVQGAKTMALPYRIDGVTWTVPEEIFHVDAKLLLITNPNAPSGTLMDLDTLARIVGGFSGVVLIDEAYVDFAPTSALALVERFANVILLRSMSKGYGLAGLRFGYGIAQPPLLTELYKVRDSYPCDAIASAAAAAAISDQVYARHIREQVCAARTELTRQLREMDFTIPESNSNFVLARMPPGIDAAAVYQQLKARNILVRYFPLPRLMDSLRITIGTPEQNQLLLSALAEILNLGILRARP